MNAYTRWIVGVFLFLPLASSAQELTLGVDVQGAYESNIFPGSIDEVDDYTVRISPSARLEDHEGDLQWSVRYRPDYEQFVETTEKSGWTHRADGELSWQINSTTRLALFDRFGRFRSVNRFNEVVTTGAGDQVADVTEFGFLDEENTRNTLDASLIHALAPTRNLEFRLGHNLIDFDREERLDRQTLSAAGHYTQTVSMRNTLGFGLSYRRSSLDGSSVLRNQSTDFYNVFGSWSYRFDDTLALNAALGPTWVKAEDRDDPVAVAEDQLLYPIFLVDGEFKLVRATSCSKNKGTLILSLACDAIDDSLTPQEAFDLRDDVTDLVLEGPVASASNQSTTYFANLSLSKRWQHWSGSLSYRRQQSDSTGLGSSAVADIVSGALNWTPSSRWGASLRAAVTRQSSASEGVRSVIAVRSADLTLDTPPGRTFTDVAESFALSAVKIDSEFEYWTFWLRLNARYSLTKRILLYGDVLYWNQTTRGDGGGGPDYDRYRIGVGIRYTFDPIRL